MTIISSAASAWKASLILSQMLPLSRMRRDSSIFLEASSSFEVFSPIAVRFFSWSIEILSFSELSTICFISVVASTSFTEESSFEIFGMRLIMLFISAP